ncbi:MAG: hypothetical protein QNK40_12850 [Desulfobacterales bacterium]|nr:hypothetical protein [Desulfobacterales bacterium]
MDKSLESRIIRLKLIDGTTVNGQVNIKKGPGYDRLSDLVGSKQEDFLVLYGASSYHKETDEQVKHKVLFVNKNHIIWAAPDDDQK